MTNFAAQVVRIFQGAVRYAEHGTIFEVKNSFGVLCDIPQRFRLSTSNTFF
jgi:hypothetical protein